MVSKLVSPEWVEVARFHNVIEGQKWFDPSAVSFFGTQFECEPLPLGFFITSEESPSGLRRFTVRRLVNGGERVETVSEFFEFESLVDAYEALRVSKDRYLLEEVNWGSPRWAVSFASAGCLPDHDGPLAVFADEASAWAHVEELRESGEWDESGLYSFDVYSTYDLTCDVCGEMTRREFVRFVDFSGVVGRIVDDPELGADQLCPSCFSWSDLWQGVGD